MTTLILGDIHAPFHHKGAVGWAIKMANAIKPDKIVQIGDARDQFSFSRYPRAHKLDPDVETKAATNALKAIWAALPKASKKYQMMGNHDDRMIKLALKGAPELVGIVGEEVERLYTFPGVELVKETELELDGVIYQHGHRAKLGDHAKYNQCSTVVGHSHTGGVVSLRNRSGVYWELNVGFLGDIDTQGFTYLTQKKVNTTTLGIGLIDEFGPRFIYYPGREA